MHRAKKEPVLPKDQMSLGPGSLLVRGVVRQYPLLRAVKIDTAIEKTREEEKSSHNICQAYNTSVKGAKSIVNKRNLFNYHDSKGNEYIRKAATTNLHFLMVLQYEVIMKTEMKTYRIIHLLFLTLKCISRGIYKIITDFFVLLIQIIRHTYIFCFAIYNYNCHKLLKRYLFLFWQEVLCLINFHLLKHKPPESFKISEVLIKKKVKKSTSVSLVWKCVDEKEMYDELRTFSSY